MKRRCLGLALLAVALPVDVHVVAEDGVHAGRSTGLPNVLIFVTDDQRGGLAAMSQTRHIFAKGGVHYPNAFVTTPVCCPSRATILTGRYAHNHRLVGQTDGQMDNLDTRTTVPYVLQRHGYRTAVFGKYFNLWPIEQPPDHFDEWVTVHGRAYDRSTWNVGGDLRLIAQHESKVIADHATSFLERQEHSGQPWFVLIGTKAPHTPFTPEAAYSRRTFPAWRGNPAVKERRRADKPPYVRSNERVTLEDGRRIRTKQLRTLLSVDELVGRVFRTLRKTGQASDTLAFFISDNGYLWGEHGLQAKDVPYTKSVKVPMLARWPGHLPAGERDGRIVGNLDIAPTIYDATRVGADLTVEVDGRSLLDAGWTRTRIHLEHWCNNRCNFWSSTRTRSAQYIETYDRKGRLIFREYYDLQRDPWQLNNLLRDGKPGNDPALAALHRRLERDKDCVGASGAHACP